MRALDERLPPHDGVAVFNRVYLAVTEELQRRITTGEFPVRRTAATLAARFADRYLSAVEAAAEGHRTPACWRPLFQYRRHPGVRPLQHALAGINAHIGHDLALAVVSTCHALRIDPPGLERDFDQVGETLITLEERIREELMPGPDLLEIADPLTHLLGSWSLQRARDGAWARPACCGPCAAPRPGRGVRLVAGLRRGPGGPLPPGPRAALPLTPGAASGP